MDKEQEDYIDIPVEQQEFTFTYQIAGDIK
jgi:hypothetical protein